MKEFYYSSEKKQQVNKVRILPKWNESYKTKKAIPTWEPEYHERVIERKDTHTNGKPTPFLELQNPPIKTNDKS